MSLTEQLDAMHRGICPDAPEASMAFEKDELIRAGVATDAPKVGEVAPDFALPGALGRQVRWQNLRSRGPLVISFYRGSWRPYCNPEMRALQQRLPRFSESGASLVASSPQVPDESLSSTEKHGLSFPVLGDVGGLVARSYGLVFRVSERLRPLYAGFGFAPPKSNGVDSFELPVSGTFVIERNAGVRGAFVDPDCKKRMEPEEILALPETMSGAA